MTPIAARGIDALEVVDELRQIFDGVDVVVRRRADELHAGLRVAQARDQLRDLVAGELTAFAGLRALRDLDLDLFGMHQVFGGDAEAAGGDLLDLVVEQVRRRRRAVEIDVDVGLIDGGIFAAFAGVGARAEHVHGGGDGLVRLGTERAERHRAGDETLVHVATALRPVRAPAARRQGGCRAGRAGRRLFFGGLCGEGSPGDRGSATAATPRARANDCLQSLARSAAARSAARPCRPCGSGPIRSRAGLWRWSRRRGRSVFGWLGRRILAVRPGLTDVAPRARRSRCRRAARAFRRSSGRRPPG